MPNCPDYRLRLFLSVDLVGSTAYKAGKGKEPVPRTARQRWVDETRHFYREFPLSLEREFNSSPIMDDATEGLCPQVWKTVGDEIIFCIRLVHSQHLGRCIWSFIKSLEAYSKHLESNQIHLDVKGVAWTAAFPAPNVTVPVSSKHKGETEGQLDLKDHEPIEASGDRDPASFEFLGKEIDAGFRVAKHAAQDRLALSLEVAYLLSQISSDGKYNFSFTYSGREELKGVINNKPYPIISIDTERRAFKRQVRAFEQAIIGDKGAQPQLLKTFLDAFMRDENIEFPILVPKGETVNDENYPESYRVFKKYWLEESKEVDQRTKVEEQSEDDKIVAEQLTKLQPPDPDSQAAIEASASELFKRFRDQH